MVEPKEDISFDGTPAWIDQVVRTRDWSPGGREATAPGRMSRMSQVDDNGGSLERIVGIMIQRTTRATVSGLSLVFRKAVRKAAVVVSRLNSMIVQMGISSNCHLRDLRQFPEKQKQEERLICH